MDRISYEELAKIVQEAKYRPGGFGMYNLTDCRNRDFSQMILNGWNLDNLDLTGSNFSYAQLHGTTFNNSNLTNCDFSNTILDSATFYNANVVGTDFSKASVDPNMYEHVVYLRK